MSKDPHLHNLIEALAQPGCALCRINQTTADKFVDAVLWELVNNIQVRQEINAARGYCRDHAWLTNRSGGALGAAIMTQGVLKTVMREVEKHDLTPGKRAKLRQMLSKADDPQTAQLHQALIPQIECPVCVQVREIERHHIAILLQHMGEDAPLTAAFNASEGICLDHVRKVVAQGTAGVGLNAILTAQYHIWQKLVGELDEFIRKSDHRFRHEPFGAEEDSWRRALTLLAGSQPQQASRPQSLSQPKNKPS